MSIVFQPSRDFKPKGVNSGIAIAPTQLSCSPCANRPKKCRAGWPVRGARRTTGWLTSRTVAALTERLDSLRREIADWESDGQQRFAEVVRKLATEDFAARARRELAAVDAELATLGYDAAAHDAVRRQEAGLRSSETAQARLQTARGALEPLENEIRSLHSQLDDRRKALDSQSTRWRQRRPRSMTLAAQTPDPGRSRAAAV